MNKKMMSITISLLIMSFEIFGSLSKSEREAEKAQRIQALRSAGIEAGLATYRVMLQDREKVRGGSSFSDPAMQSAAFDFDDKTRVICGNFRRYLIEAFPQDLRHNDLLELERSVPVYKSGVLQPSFTKVKKVNAQEGCCSIM